MSAITLLIGLLVVAYVGSHLVGPNASYRLPSGTEYLLLGVAVGPHVFALADRSMLESFEPLAAVGAAWLTLVTGASYGHGLGRKVARRGFLCGVALSLLTFGVVFGAAYIVLPHLYELSARTRISVAAATAIVSTETTAQAVKWVIGRNGVAGPLSRLTTEMAESDVLTVIAALAVALPWLKTDAVTPLRALGWAGATVLLGTLLGITAAALLRGEPRASDGWGVIIGGTLVAGGISVRLGLSAQVCTFAVGLSLAALSRHRTELRAMLARSEQAVLFPVLFLAGALVKVDRPSAVIAVTLGAFVLRLFARAVMAPVMTRLAGAPKDARLPLSFGLLPSGAISVAVALELSSHLSGERSNLILALTAGLLFLGELVGPAALKRAFVLAGEEGAAPPSIPPPPPRPSARPPMEAHS